ncbi:MAG: dienelactone hydrolase family protein [Marivibrio sp.]|uniref:dienelactone hydrolase family protein n=1 Tax=Marivibrio sp. TaxID=2039719 RepID=UPI0032ED8504
MSARSRLSRPLSRREAAGALAGAALGAAALVRGGSASAAAQAPAPPSGERVTLTLSDGAEVAALLHRPANGAPAPGVLLLPEWWGLTDAVAAAAADLAARGYAALAVDLTHGRRPTTPEAARALIDGLDPARTREALIGWTDWLARGPAAGEPVGALGWGFGGGWALATALAAPLAACVVYYGRVNRPTAELAALQGPVLGHFAERDPFIDRAMVADFIAATAAAGGALTVYWYDADHAFANPADPAYDAEAAARAWDRTTSFLDQALKADA